MKFLVIFCLLTLFGVSANFHLGDYVQTSRRGQFHQKRTTWHDLQGRHCPRFNVDTTVAVPIAKPKEYDSLDEYKMQLSFDHERLYSSWLTILAKPGAAGSEMNRYRQHQLTDDVQIPRVMVQLWKREDLLIKVRVGFYRFPAEFMKRHPDLVAEYKNRTHWPKHVLVEYHWMSLDEVDAERGMMFIVYGGVLIIVCMIIGVSFSSHEKVSQLLKDIASEATSSAREEEKAE